MGALSVLRGVTKGIGEASGNQDAVQDIDNQQERARQQKNAQMQMKITPLVQALRASQTRLALFADPNDPSKAAAGKEVDYEKNMQDVTGNLRALRNLMGEKAPGQNPNALESAGAGLLDRLHVTRDLQNHLREHQAAKVNQYNQGTTDMANATVQGIMPDELTTKITEMQKAGATPAQIEEYKRETFNPTATKAKPELKNFRNPATGEVKLFDASRPESIPQGFVLAPTGAGASQPGVKPLETGGVPYGVQDQTTGKTYLASQMNDPATPSAVRETWGTIQSAIKNKQDEENKRQDEIQNRFLRSQADIATRMGQSEAFQERMADFREREGVYKGLDTQARNAQSLVDTYSAQYSQPGNHSATDTALITDYTSVLAKGGRKTTSEIRLAQNIGSFKLNLEQKFKKATTGELPDALRQMYLDYMMAAAKTERQEADAAKPDLPTVKVPETPQAKKLKDTLQSMRSGSPPPGATHIVPGRDGRNHYTNDAGTVDLGVAPQ